MTLEKLNRKDVRLIVICAIVAAISCYVGVKYFFKAFPEASIEFKTTKDSSLPIAGAFLSQVSLDPAGYKHAAVFGFDDEQKVFLERELGVEEAKAVLDRTVRLWRWQHRWFRPLEKEEYRVDVTTRGEPVGFSHLLPEEAPGANLAQAEARSIAEGFLAKTMHRPLEGLMFVEGSLQKRPKRTDHTFTWKLEGVDIKGADYRIEVGIAGDRPVSYQEYLKIPDTWKRDYLGLRNKNTTAGLVDTALLLLTGVGMLVLLVIRLRSGDIRWGAAAILGGITFVLQVLSALNTLPSDLMDYDTTTSFGGFIVEAILQALLSGLLFGAVIFLIAAASEPAYRDRFPRFLSVTSLLRLRAFRTKEYFIASVAGITLTFFFFAYENVFYIIANSLGAWAPREVAYSDLLSTAFPWVFVLFIGWFPAISEEFVSRMFSIPIFEKLLKSRVLAMVLAAFIWGFGHAAYPNQPFWIRGLEVGLAGIVFGLAMYRFGIAATVICHFSVDALYTAFVLIRSPNPYYVISASLAAGTFAIIFLGTIVAYLLRGGFRPAEMTNEAEQAVAMREAALSGAGLSAGMAGAGTMQMGADATGVTARYDWPGEGQPGPESTGWGEGAQVRGPTRTAYAPLSQGRILGGLVIAGILVAAACLPVRQFGDWVDFKVTPQRARESAASFLRGCGFDVSAYRQGVLAVDRSEPLDAAYLLETGGFETAATVYKEKIPTPIWRVRFFVPGQKEEFAVSVEPTSGAAIGFSRKLLDDAPGASLEKAEALQVAERFVAARGQDPKAGELKEQTAKDEKARRDHTLVWDYPVAGAGEAKIRYEAVVQGDAVGSWGRGVKIPEEWERERQKQTVRSIILKYVKIPVLGILAGFAMVLLVTKIRQGEIPWKFALIAGGAGGILVGLSGVLKLGTLWASQYQTEVPAAGFWVIITVSLFVGAVVFFLLVAAVCALAGSLHPAAVSMFSRAGRRLYAKDALIAGLISAGFAFGLPVLTRFLASAIPAGRMLDGVPVPPNLDAGQPALALLAGVATRSILWAAFGGIAAGLLSTYFKNAYLRAGLALALLVAFIPSSARKPAELILGIVSVAVVGAGVYLLAYVFLRDNPLAWVWGLWFAFGCVASIELLRQSAPFYRWNGAIALVLVVLPGFWLLKDALFAAAEPMRADPT